MIISSAKDNDRFSTGEPDPGDRQYMIFADETLEALNAGRHPAQAVASVGPG
jgi:hypothetical protein